MPRCRDFPGMSGDRHFEAVGDAACAVDEDDRGFRRKDFACGLFEKFQPAVEMLGLEGQFQVGRHRSSFISAGLENDGRPESRDLRDVVVPIVHSLGKDRADGGILTRASVESGYQSFY